MKILSHDKSNGLPEKYPHIRFRLFLIMFPIFMSIRTGFILEGWQYDITEKKMIHQNPNSIMFFSTI